MYTITNNITNTIAITTAERIARAQYSEEYKALYNRLDEAAMQWNTVRAFARTKENARAIRAFDRAFSEARKEFADGLYPEALRILKKARCSLAEIF